MSVTDKCYCTVCERIMSESEMAVHVCQSPESVCSGSIPLPGSNEPIKSAVPPEGTEWERGDCFIRHNGRGIDVYDFEGENFLFHLNGAATEYDVRNRVRIWQKAFSHGEKMGRATVQTRIKRALGL